MLFWIFAIITVLGAIGIYAIDSLEHDFLWGTSLTVFIFSGIALIASICIMMVNYIGVDGYIAQCEARYESLMYQYENDIYDNDNDIGKRELMSDIQSWNEDLARLRVNQDNFWIGIYRPNIYDQFEFIELKGE